MHEDPRTSSRAPRTVVCGCLLAASLIACETVVVSMVEVSDVEVVPPSITVVEGRSETAAAVLRESGGVELSDRSVTWSVDDPEIASVTPAGVVRGLAPGTTLVRAESEGVSGAAEVTVLREDDDDEGRRDDDDDDEDEDDDEERDDEGACDVRNQIFSSGVTLPRGSSCVYTDVRIRGRLELREGARLVATRLAVDGSIEADGAEALVLESSQVYGDLKFEKGGSVTIRGSYVEKKAELKSNLGAVELSDNRIEEVLRLEDNRGGPFTLLRNTSARLECKENNPAPTGSGNQATRQATGQCAGL